MKNNVNTVPKEFVRRKLVDGTESLRVQLRETAQRGQASDYGGDQIEDTSATGAGLAGRGVVSGTVALLKRKKEHQSRVPTEENHTAANLPAIRNSPREPVSQNPPDIKTQNALSGREYVLALPEKSGTQPLSLPDNVELPAAPKAGNPAIKVKNVGIRERPAAGTKSLPQKHTQEQRQFAQERGRSTAIKRAKVQSNKAAAAPVQRGNISLQPVHRPVSPANPDTQPVRESGKTIVKAGHSVRKAPESATRYIIKKAEKSSRKNIKTVQRTAQTAARTAKTTGQTIRTTQKTAQATVKATQRTVQAARATSKAAATTAKAAANATVTAIKAAIVAAQELAAAIAAGGGVAIVVILVICLVGLLIASPFGIFFSDGNHSPDAISPSAAVAQINREYADTLSSLQAGGSYDSVEITGRPPSWMDVFAVFAVKTVTGDNMDVVVLDADRVERLRTVFWDMTKIITEVTTLERPATDDTDAWTETILTITVTPRTTDDMRVFYQFAQQQNELLDELLTEESRALWNELLYGSSGEIIAVALSQVGNVGGQPYWSWYGFTSRVEWCACFVSWCANECGYIDDGVIPKFASCSIGSQWFKDHGHWQDNSYEPNPGDLIFFDWDDGDDGQNGVPDHVGIVERVESGVVYTVEGNSGDSCRQRSYSVGHYEIYGYGTPIYTTRASGAG